MRMTTDWNGPLSSPWCVPPNILEPVAPTKTPSGMDADRLTGSDRNTTRVNRTSVSRLCVGGEPTSSYSYVFIGFISVLYLNIFYCPWCSLISTSCGRCCGLCWATMTPWKTTAWGFPTTLQSIGNNDRRNRKWATGSWWGQTWRTVPASTNITITGIIKSQQIITSIPHTSLYNPTDLD